MNKPDMKKNNISKKQVLITEVVDMETHEKRMREWRWNRVVLWVFGIAFIVLVILQARDIYSCRKQGGQIIYYDYLRATSRPFLTDCALPGSKFYVAN